MCCRGSRNVAVVAAALGLFQGVVWAVLGVLGFLLYATCQPAIPQARSFGYVLYLLYFFNPQCAQPPDLGVGAWAVQTARSDTTRVLSIAYMAASVAWAAVSLPLLLVALGRVSGHKCLVASYSWSLVGVASLALDAVATGAYGFTINDPLPILDQLDPTMQDLKVVMAQLQPLAAALMMLVTSRVVVLWAADAFLVCCVALGAKQLRDSFENDKVMSTQPPTPGAGAQPPADYRGYDPSSPPQHPQDPRVSGLRRDVRLLPEVNLRRSPASSIVEEDLNRQYQQYPDQIRHQQYPDQVRHQQYPDQLRHQQYPDQVRQQQYPDQPRHQQYPDQVRPQQYPDQPRHQQYPDQARYQQYPDQPRHQQYPDQPRHQQYPDQPRHQQYPEQPRYQQYPEQPPHQQQLQRPFTYSPQPHQQPQPQPQPQALQQRRPQTVAEPPAQPEKQKKRKDKKEKARGKENVIRREELPGYSILPLKEGFDPATSPPASGTSSPPRAPSPDDDAPEDGVLRGDTARRNFRRRLEHQLVQPRRLSPVVSLEDYARRDGGQQQRLPPEQLRSLLPWSYLAPPDDAPPRPARSPESDAGMEMPPVPVPDYTLHFGQRPRDRLPPGAAAGSKRNEVLY